MLFFPRVVMVVRRVVLPVFLEVEDVVVVVLLPDLLVVESDRVRFPLRVVVRYDDPITVLPCWRGRLNPLATERALKCSQNGDTPLRVYGLLLDFKRVSACSAGGFLPRNTVLQSARYDRCGKTLA